MAKSLKIFTSACLAAGLWGCAPAAKSDPPAGRFQIVQIATQYGGAATTLLLISDTQTGETKILGYLRAKTDGPNAAKFWLGRSFSEIPYGADVNKLAKDLFPETPTPLPLVPVKNPHGK